MHTDNSKPRAYDYYSSIMEQKVDWLWYPYIPYGKITLLQGDPGEGKSTFILHLTAILTNGGSLPDGAMVNAPQTVIYQCAEDGMQDTIKPRLIQAGADCSKVAFINDNDQSLSLDDARIEEAIKDTGAKLFVLDPIQAYIKQDGDLQSATRMRSLIRRLSIVAEKYSCAIVLIGHLNKSAGGKTLYRGLGSIDIAAIARSVLMIARDIERTEIRYMFPVKSSLAPEGYGIGFVLDSDTGFHWIGKCQIQNAELEALPRRSISKQDRAKELLRLMLSVEDLKSTEVFSRLKWLNISERTIRIAQKSIGIEAYRRGNVWYLRLPDSESADGEE